MKYIGDFTEDSTITFAFSTNDGSGGRASFSATLEEADIVIFKDGTAITLDASTITITSEPGSRTGIHIISVDMSNDADFTTGSDYIAVLYPSDETVDSQSVAAILAQWSCENRSVNVARIGGSDVELSSDNRLSVDAAEWNDVPLATTNPLPNAAPDAAGGLVISDAGGLDIDAKLATATSDLATAANLATVDGVVDAILVDTNELQSNQGNWLTATGFMLATENGSSFSAIPNMATVTNQTAIAGYLDTEIAAILADTNELQADWADGGRLDLILDGRASQSSVDTIDGIVDSILIDTAEIGIAGAGLTSLPVNDIADAVLNRGASNIEDTADRHSLGAVVMMSTNSALSGGNITAKKPSDDSTFATYVVTSDASSDNITGVS